MGFRTVVVNTRCKLELKLNYLVCRGDEIQRIFIDEISTLIIHSTAVAVTSALLSELIKHNVKIIFCDEKHNPSAELLPYFGSYNNALKLRQQISWNETTKQLVWTDIVVKKITNQAKLLLKRDKTSQAEQLMQYVEQVQINDLSNREGHAAKVYWSAMFNKGWSRNCGDFYSKALNYGYTILLSTFNREIAKCGYSTQLGIWHENQYNDFNLSCDMMEVFRPVVDEIVINLKENDENFKSKLVAMQERKVKIDGKEMYLENAIEVYIRSVLSALNTNNISGILNYE